MLGIGGKANTVSALQILVDCLGDQNVNTLIPCGPYVTAVFGKGPLQAEKGRTWPGVETEVKGSLPGTGTHELSLDSEADPIDKTRGGS